LIAHNDIKKVEICLAHALDERVDEMLTVSGITAFDKVKELALMESTVGVGELESPKE